MWPQFLGDFKREGDYCTCTCVFTKLSVRPQLYINILRSPLIVLGGSYQACKLLEVTPYPAKIHSFSPLNFYHQTSTATAMISHHFTNDNDVFLIFTWYVVKLLKFFQYLKMNRDFHHQTLPTWHSDIMTYKTCRFCVLITTTLFVKYTNEYLRLYNPDILLHSWINILGNVYHVYYIRNRTVKSHDMRQGDPLSHKSTDGSGMKSNFPMGQMWTHHPL